MKIGDHATKAPALLLHGILLLALAISGCTTTTTSRLPKGQPCGYVEFRPNGHFGGPIDIRLVTNEGWSSEQIGRAGYTTRKAKVRVALAPGEYNFGIGLGTGHRVAHVKVREACTTPVLIQITKVHEKVEYHRYMTKVAYAFKLAVVVQDPMPNQ